MTTLIEHLDFVLTVDERNTRLEDAAVVIKGDRIADVGSTREVVDRLHPAEADRVIDGRRRGAVPGFVDLHVHLSETLSRASFPDNLSTRPWVFDWVMPYYGRLGPEDERMSVLVGMMEMLRCGTTCFLDMGAINDPGITVTAAVEVGIRGVTGRHAADRRPETLPDRWWPEMVEKHFFPNANAALEALEQAVRDWDGAGDGRVRCWVNIQGKEPCSAELHVGARELAERLGVGTTYHIASSLKEAEISERNYGTWPITRFERLGGLGSNLVLAHAVATSEPEIRMLADHGTKVAFCPGTSLKLAKGATRVGRYPEMLTAGVTVGVGTDGVSASGNLDLMRQLYLVAGLFKDARTDAEIVGAQRALRMATIEGARALGMAGDIGSLEAGKKADFVLFNLDHPEWIPHADPLQALVWSATPASISETWVDGVAVFAEGRVQTIDHAGAIFAEARERSARVLRDAGLDAGQETAPSVVYE